MEAAVVSFRALSKKMMQKIGNLSWDMRCRVENRTWDFDV